MGGEKKKDVLLDAECCGNGRLGNGRRNRVLGCVEKKVGKRVVWGGKIGVGGGRLQVPVSIEEKKSRRAEKNSS